MNLNNKHIKKLARFAMLGLATLFGTGAWAAHDVRGITGTLTAPGQRVFDLVTATAHIPTPDGGSILVWGYGVDQGAASSMQYPGPTLIVNEGDQVTIHLRNIDVPLPVSILFPGQKNVVATGGHKGVATQESRNSTETVTYSFVARHPGTYLYRSGTRSELEVEMGMVGALIVRPSGYDPVNNRIAYHSPDSAYTHEYLLLLTEMDPDIHAKVEAGQLNLVDDSTYFPTLWFINGRNGPDTVAPDNLPWLPHQPYSALPRMHPGERILMRVIGAGRDPHPFHHHGNNSTVIAKDGHLLSTGTVPAPGGGVRADLAYSDYTLTTTPGQTIDAIFEWTGKGLGWDIWGHHPGDGVQCVDNNGDLFDDTTHEYCPDHDKPIPVVLPGVQDLTYGSFYSGSPFLGHAGLLPQGQQSLNATGGYFLIWHSHTEKELTNADIYPGGMLTFVVIEPWVDANGKPVNIQ